MGLARADFCAFFAAMHDGQPPFDWQERLLDVLLDTGCWPTRVVAPTGAGKTAVIDVHVFAQALTADTDLQARPPRRLSLVVGRRALVDDQHEYARTLARCLADPEAKGVMGEVAERLWSLRLDAGEGRDARANRDQDPDLLDAHAQGTSGSPLVVGRLRGGEQPSRAWRDYPTAAAVLCATPDMWGSRVLFRGYGASPKAWPREAGLLAFDSVVVVDEAHLAQQFLHTARRVGELAAVADAAIPVAPLQVVETTATPAGTGSNPGRTVPEVQSRIDIGVGEQDLDNDTLRDRLTRPKPVRVVPLPNWSSTREPHRRAVTTALADLVVELRRTPTSDKQGNSAPDVNAVDPGPAKMPTPTVGCFVNTVSRALDVAAELRSRAIDGRRLRVVTICGQVRPHDLDRLRAEHPGVLSPRGNHDIDVIVSTQSLEVGVDLDLAGMVTELASGAALAQRAGRVNRRGLRAEGPITVVVPDDEPTEDTRCGPYAGDELLAALHWVGDCAGDPQGMAPWRLRDLPPPQAAPRRPLYQRPELAEAWQWARTSDDLAADPELDLWLSEDLRAETSVSIAVRAALPVAPEQACQLLRTLPPRRHELFGVPYRTAVTALRHWDAANRQREEATRDQTDQSPAPLPLVVRGEEVAVLTWRDSGDDPQALPARQVPAATTGRFPGIRPGDIIVFDDREALFTPTTASPEGGFTPAVVAPADGDDAKVPACPAADVLEAPADLDRTWPSREVGSVVLRLEPALVPPGYSRDRYAAAFAELTAALSALARDHENDHEEGHEPDEPDPRRDPARVILHDWLVRTGLTRSRPMAAAAARLLQTAPARAELIIQYADTDDRPPEDTNRDGYDGYRDEDGGAPIARVILRDRRRPVVDEDLRQVWSPSRRSVTLARHQQAVSRRAALFGQRVGLGPDLVAALQAAGEHHDDGKADDRFQRRLGRRGQTVLAKSRTGLSMEYASGSSEHLRSTGDGLPARWRHEQRSVLDSWAAVQQLPDLDPLLVSRLVGTSHGHGRAGFPHAAVDLLDTAPEQLRDLAVEIFDHGAWDELIDRTHHHYGVWACAYLEALLRAADAQVSQEGT